MKAVQFAWLSAGAAALLWFAGNAFGGGHDKKLKGDFEAFFKKLDLNKDDKLDKSEFLKIADRAKDKETARMKLGDAYDQLDPKMLGITKEQFRQYLEKAKAKSKYAVEKS